MNVAKFLNEGRIEGNVYFLPDVQLNRKDYQEVAKALQGIEGKWNRKAGGFIFPENPEKYLKRLCNREKINLKKEFQFFPTPPEIVRRMLGWTMLNAGMKVLEPSAGKGNILKFFPDDVQAEYYELNPDWVKIIKEVCPNATFRGHDFLEAPEREEYDIIVANPPFSGNQDITHVLKMYEVLKPGGRMVTIMSAHFLFAEDKASRDFRSWLNKCPAWCNHIELEDGAFTESGTNAATVMLIIDK